MSHPQERLNRHLVGQGLGRVRPQMKRLWRRRVREVKRLVELPEPKEPRGSSVRALYPPVQPAPNSPQLIRILRHPFKLDLGYFGRTRAPSRGMVSRETRESYRTQLEQVLHGSRRVQMIRPTDHRLRLQPRDRPSIEVWLGEQGSHR